MDLSRMHKPVPFMDLSRMHKRSAPAPSPFDRSLTSAWYCDTPRWEMTTSFPGARPILTAELTSGFSVKCFGAESSAPSKEMENEKVPSPAMLVCPASVNSAVGPFSPLTAREHGWGYTESCLLSNLDD